MENLISLVKKLQRACTALGDHGDESALPTVLDSLPSIAVVGGQLFCSCKLGPDLLLDVLVSVHRHVEPAVARLPKFRYVVRPVQKSHLMGCKAVHPTSSLAEMLLIRTEFTPNMP
ncbi:hypothetical protein QYE76_030449 [Lolium multiflorum]|uniref:Uncharacterized protein n=1 Tax=Lolium multiflorum TaxID=4521 RepID=A0AAD8QR70_LOLMU|nr:hypothetical protein QYE76_030449 [Lolium multiflorum]